jgi:hypothetical protein
MTLPAWKKTVFTACLIMGLSVFLAGFAELAARFLGAKPWDVVIPRAGSRGGFAHHPRLGFTVRPGVIQGRIGDETYVIHVTDDHQRICRPIEEPDESGSRPEIWFMGCSITFGHGVSDHQTFAWLFQEAFPEYHVENFACSAYSTVHSYLQLKDAFTYRSPPHLVFLFFTAGHEHRNTCDRRWREELMRCGNPPSMKYPCVTINKDGNLATGLRTIEYQPFPLVRYSSVMTLLQQTFDARKSQKILNQTITVELIKAINKLCVDNGSNFVLASVDLGPETLETLGLCAEAGIQTGDIGVDLSGGTYTFIPLDPHPNPAGHSALAENLIAYVRNECQDTPDKTVEIDIP